MRVDIDLKIVAFYHDLKADAHYLKESHTCAHVASTLTLQEDIVRLAKTAGVPVDAGQMLRMADADGDGVVGEEDFVHIMSQVRILMHPCPSINAHTCV